MGLQGDAALGLRVFELVDRGEMPMGERGVGEGPPVLSRLPLGGIRRQAQQMDLLGHAQLGAGMPAGAVEDQHDLLLRPGANLAGEGGQLGREAGDAEGGGQGEARAARRRLDEADDVAPRVTVRHGRAGALPVAAPDLVQDRLQPDAVFVGGPELDARLGVRGGDGLDERPALLLQAACASGSAGTCRGRGLRRFPSKRTRYAQPR